MGLAARTRWTVRRYWADRLGVTPDDFDGGTSVGAADEGGVQLFERGDTRVVAAPGSLVEALRSRRETTPPVADPEAVREWVPASVSETLGPTFYGYIDRERFDPVDSSARVLCPPDEPAHDRFRAAVTETEWRQGAPEFEPGRTAGIFVGETLVATAGYEVWDGLLAHVGVVTHPDHRNQGFGQAVVSLATERALAEGLLPQYRTLEEWTGSVRLAEGLGYTRYVSALLVTLEDA